MRGAKSSVVESPAPPLTALIQAPCFCVEIENFADVHTVTDGECENETEGGFCSSRLDFSL